MSDDAAALGFGQLRARLSGGARSLTGDVKARTRRQGAAERAYDGRSLRSGPPKVQFNQRISERAATLARGLAEADGVAVGGLIERLITEEAARRRRAEARRGGRTAAGGDK